MQGLSTLVQLMISRSVNICFRHSRVDAKLLSYGGCDTMHCDLVLHWQVSFTECLLTPVRAGRAGLFSIVSCPLLYLFVNSSTLDTGSLQRPVAHTTDYRAPRKEGSLHRVAACVSYRTLKRSGVLLWGNFQNDALVAAQ